MARMEIPVLDKFCLIFDLWTGCMVMGVFNSFMTFLVALCLIFMAVDIKDAAEARRDDFEQGMPSVVYTIVVLLAVLLLFKFVSDLIFAYAMYKEKCKIIKKYCIFWIIFLVLLTVGVLKSLFHMEAVYVISLILYLGENLYYLIVIRSYLISINEDGVL